MFYRCRQGRGSDLGMGKDKAYFIKRLCSYENIHSTMIVDKNNKQRGVLSDLAHNVGHIENILTWKKYKLIWLHYSLISVKLIVFLFSAFLTSLLFTHHEPIPGRILKLLWFTWCYMGSFSIFIFYKNYSISNHNYSWL